MAATPFLMGGDEVSAVLAYISAQQPLRADWVQKQPIDHRFLGLNRRWNQKWMALFPHVIVWFRHPGAVPRGYLLLAPTTAVGEEPGKGSAIEVTSSSGRKLRFRAKDAAGHAGWLANLQAVLMDRRRELAAPPHALSPHAPSPRALLHGVPTAEPPPASCGRLAPPTQSGVAYAAAPRSSPPRRPRAPRHGARAPRQQSAKSRAPRRAPRRARCRAAPRRRGSAAGWRTPSQPTPPRPRRARDPAPSLASTCSARLATTPSPNHL